MHSSWTALVLTCRIEKYIVNTLALQTVHFGEKSVTCNEFHQQVMRHGGSQLSQESREYAVLYCEEQGRTSDKDVKMRLDLARFIESAFAYRDHRREQARLVDDRPMPEMGIASDRLLSKLEPWRAQICKTFFGDAHPPFGSSEEGAAWAKREAMDRHGWMAMEEGEESEAAQLDEVTQILKKVRIETASPTNPELIGRNFRELAWISNGGETRSLRELECETREKSELTGFSQLDLLLYILTGQKPILPDVRVVERGAYAQPIEAEWFSYPSVIHEFFSRDLTFLDHREVYRQSRAKLNRSTQKPLSEEDQRFLDIIKQHGPMPPRGKGNGREAYCERIRSYRNATNPHKPLNSWDAVKRKYERLQNKLAAHGL